MDLLSAGRRPVHSAPRPSARAPGHTVADGDRAGRALSGPFWPALDGLRAIAVLAVLGVHVNVLPGGYLGVDVFFVLSGFLITTLLINEWDRREAISFRRFYARRALRLFPVLGCVLAASALLAWALETAAGGGARAVATGTFGAEAWVSVFAVNWVRALGFSHSLGLLGPTWSLSVEEQFYLLWPVIATLALWRGWRRGKVALSLTVLAAAAMGWRATLVAMGFGHDRIYFATDSHCDGLLAGCAVAFWFARGRTARVPGWLAITAVWTATAVLGTLFLIGNENGPQMPLEITATVLASAALVSGIAAGAVPRPVQRLLCSEWAGQVGRRSYGLYLWQYPVLFASLAVAGHWATAVPGGARHLVLAAAFGLGGAACFALAELSYRFVEAPALRIKQRLRQAALRLPATPELTVSVPGTIRSHPVLSVPRTPESPHADPPGGR